ncbi:MAG: secondary thiamine-phosphate synthase enzyme YjbQ [Pseudomonadota bacterium]
MSTYQRSIDIQTRGRGSIEITTQVGDLVRTSGIVTGVAHVFVQHTSCSLMITENADPSVRRDLETLAQRWAPDGDQAYQHDNEGDDDMAAHARSVLTGNSVSVPVGAGELLFGKWQGIYLWEHRTSPHGRTVVVTVVGE